MKKLIEKMEKETGYKYAEVHEAPQGWELVDESGWYFTVKGVEYCVESLGKQDEEESNFLYITIKNNDTWEYYGYLKRIF